MRWSGTRVRATWRLHAVDLLPIAFATHGHHLGYLWDIGASAQNWMRQASSTLAAATQARAATRFCADEKRAIRASRPPSG